MKETSGRTWRAVVAGLAVLAVTVLCTVVATLALTGDNTTTTRPAAQPSGTAVPTTVPATQAPATSAPVATLPHTPSPTSATSGRGWKETGFLTGVQRSGGKLTVTVDRVVFLTGDDAVEANGGVPPENDYVMINKSHVLRTYAVDSDATFLGVDVLGSDGDSQSIQQVTAQQFYERAQKAIAGGGTPFIDMWHRPAPGNSVTWLSEHWLP